MWCVKCHTAFSWRTGAIETKIHNPHYYEWMRSKSANGEIPREEGDAAGQGTEDEAGGLAGGLDPKVGEGCTEGDNQEGGDVHFPAVPLKKGGKGGAELVANGVNEKDKAEVPEEVKDLGLNLPAETGKDDSGEKNPGDAETEAADFDFSDPGAEGDEAAEDEEVKGGGGHRILV